jgi:hypothetical protein
MPVRLRAPGRKLDGSASSTIQTRQRIHPYGNVRVPSIKAGTRPDPIGRFLDQSATHRIVVNVFDDVEKRAGLEDVAIVAAASLPETIVHFAVGLNILQTLQKSRGLLTQKLEGFAMDRDFESGADKTHFVDGVVRTEQYMDMLGHDDIGPKGQATAAAGGFHRIDKPTAATVPAQ